VSKPLDTDPLGSSASLRLMIVVGEASADRYAARVLEALRARSLDVEAFGVGGEELRRQGLDGHADARELELVGFSAVLTALPRLFRLYRRLTALLRERRPDVLLCVDLPDFNSRLARRARALGIPVLFYVAPQVWAWRSGRVRSWRGLASQLVVTLPFEVSLWQRAGVPVAFHGHPLLEEASTADPGRDATLARLGLDPARRTLVLAPGSRPSEWRHHAEVLFAAAARICSELPELQLALPLAPSLQEEPVRRVARRVGIQLTCTRAPHRLLLQHADLGLLCSGTLTLEAALAGLPMVVFYRTGWVDARIARRLIQVDRIALPNLLLGGAEPVFPELLQRNLSAPRLADEALRLLHDDAERARLRNAGLQLRAELGSGSPSHGVADAILALAKPAREPSGTAKARQDEPRGSASR